MRHGNCNQGRRCTCAAEDQETSQGVMLGAALGAAVWAAVLLVVWWVRS